MKYCRNCKKACNNEFPPPHLDILQATIPANRGAPPAAAKHFPLCIVDEGYLTGGPLGHDGKVFGGQNHNLKTDMSRKEAN